MFQNFYQYYNLVYTNICFYSDDSSERPKPKTEDSNEFGESKLKQVVRNTVGAKSEIKVSKKVSVGFLTC